MGRPRSANRVTPFTIALSEDDQARLDRLFLLLQRAPRAGVDASSANRLARSLMLDQLSYLEETMGIPPIVSRSEIRDAPRYERLPPQPLSALAPRTPRVPPVAPIVPGSAQDYARFEPPASDGTHGAIARRHGPPGMDPTMPSFRELEAVSNGVPPEEAFKDFKLKFNTPKPAPGADEEAPSGAADDSAGPPGAPWADKP